jgi:photosystem I subunit 11
MTTDFVPPAGDPQVGNLATPINSSGFSRVFINNLPAYRKGLTPFRRGLEVGMAHGYLLYGPFTFAGPFRNSDISNLAGVVGAAGLVVILTICLSLYASVTESKPVATFPVTNPPTSFDSGEGWSDFSGGFLMGGIGGALTAYWLTASGLFQIIPQSLLN